jgi:hypothetical protein
MRRVVPLVFPALLCALAASPAYAVEPGRITFSGGFTEYSGPAQSFLFTTPSGLEFFGSRYEVDNAFFGILGPSEPLPGDAGAILAANGYGITTQSLLNNALPSSRVDLWIGTGPRENLNSLVFTPADPQGYNGTPGEEFRIGTFTFQNGGWFGTTPYNDPVLGEQTYALPPSRFQFTVTATVSDATGNATSTHTFTDVLELLVTGPTWNNPLPEDDADYLSFVGRRDLGYVGAFESSNLPPGGSTEGSIDMFGRIGSLVPTRFANPQGMVLASEIPTAPIPEPHTWALMLAGLAGIWASVKRRRQA